MRPLLYPATLCASILPLTPVFACDIALILAIDVSGSVNAQEYRIQLDGLAEALNDGSVSEALVVNKAAVLVMQWSGTSRQEVSIDWRHIARFEDVDHLAADVMQVERAWRDYSTAIGEALQLALDRFTEVPACTRRIVDVSGDGVSNEGMLPSDIWPALAAAGVTVNGLAIESDVPDLAAYFRSSVIRGAGSFAMSAANYADYPRAIRLKLLREITQQTAFEVDRTSKGDAG